MDEVLFFLMFFIVISFHLKGYYTYRFLVVEEFKRPDGGLFKFSFNAAHITHKLHAFSFFPVLSKASSEESKKAKTRANLFLVIFYICVVFVVGYSFIVGKYVTP